MGEESSLGCEERAQEEEEDSVSAVGGYITGFGLVLLSLQKA